MSDDNSTYIDGGREYVRSNATVRVKLIVKNNGDWEVIK
jgi:hypothetical protein